MSNIGIMMQLSMGDGFPGSESIIQIVSQVKELDISDVSLFKERSFSVNWENSEFRRELAPIVAEILYLFSKLPQKFEIYFQVFCLVKSCWFESVLHHWIESGPGTNVTPDRLFTQFTILQNCISLSFLHSIFFSNLMIVLLQKWHRTNILHFYISKSIK